MASSAADAFTRARHRYESGDFDQAAALCRQLLQAEPSRADALDLLALVAFRNSDFSAAIGFVRRAIANRPNFAGYHVHLGQMLRASGNLPDAISSYEDALRISPDSDQAHNCLGRVRLEDERFGDALDCFDSAIAAAPLNGDAHNNRGIAMFELQRYDEAVCSYERSLAIDPTAVGPLTNLGNLLRHLGRLDEAERYYNEALRLHPSSKEAHHNLGNVYREQGRLEQAADCYTAAIALDARFATAHRSLADIREQQEQFPQAASSYRTVEALQPDAALGHLRSMTMCPTVFDDNAEIDDYRDRLLAKIERSAGDSSQLRLRELGSFGEPPPFNLMYHGRSDLTIKKAYAALFEGRLPKFTPLSTPGKPRLGFVVTRGHERAFACCMGPLLEQLLTHELDIAIVCTSHSAAQIRMMLSRDLLPFVVIPQRLDRAAEAIREHGFALLYYWEVGSDSTNYFLAHLRLAPIQCTSWGVPVTTGIPTVDYYLSSSLLEAADNTRDYTEQLVKLDTLPTVQPLPEPCPPAARESLGFGKNEVIYLCVQNLAKVHPDFDAVIGEILRSHAAGRVVFLADRHGYVKRRLDNRLQCSIPDVYSHVSFLPRTDVVEYRRLLAASDVVLDTLHYGGVMTTYDALALAKPIVTLAGPNQRTRYAAACYRQMGIPDCTAESTAEYVAIANRLGKEHDFRRAVTQRLAERAQLLFADESIAPSYAHLFHSLLAAHAS